VYRTYTMMESLYWGDYSFSYARNLKADNLGVVGLAGLQYRPSEKLALGLVVQTPTRNLGGSGDFQEDYAIGLAGYESAGSSYARDLNTENGLPAKITLGISWERPKEWALAADVTHHMARDSHTLEGATDTGQPFLSPTRREPVTNINIGGEYYMKEKYPLRAGFFTSFSSAPDTSVETMTYSAHEDLYGLTASVGSESEHVAINVGLSYLFGSGTDYGMEINENGLTPCLVDASDRHLYVFFSTSYYF